MSSHYDQIHILFLRESDQRFGRIAAAQMMFIWYARLVGNELFEHCFQFVSVWLVVASQSARHIR